MSTVSRVEINAWLRLLEEAEALLRRLPLSSLPLGSTDSVLDLGVAIGKVLIVRREIQAATVTDVVIDDA